MKLMIRKYSNIFLICFFSILILVFLNFGIHIYRTIRFNNIEREINPNNRECLFNLQPRGGTGDSWDKDNALIDGEYTTLTGVTYDGVIANNSKYEIPDWTVRINARSECYINKAWCGFMEIHQFRNGKENVQTLDLRNCKKEEIELEFVEAGLELLISLRDGDYLIYKPSTEASEFPVKAFNGSSGTVTIGMIFYSKKNTPPILSDYSVKYRFNKSYFQGLEPKIFFIMLIILLFSLIVRLSMTIAYKKAQADAEAMMNIQKIHDLEELNEKITNINTQLEESNSVISAISEIYKILYKVNIENDTFVAIRTSEAANQFLSKYTKASEASKVLPDALYESENIEVVREFYDVNTWQARLKNTNIYTKDFRGKYTGWLRTNLIAAKRDENGNAIEILAALQDVDKIVRDEQEKKRQLEIANKVMKSYNETLNEEIKMRIAHVKEIQQKLVISLASVIGNRDSDTGGHVNRTSDIIKIIVDEIRKQNENLIDDQTFTDIVRAAPMHDLGKIYIPASILCKPGKLTADEYEKMKEHSTNSGDIVNLILKEIEEDHFVKTAYNVARFHHERWDGNGYPEKLRGEEIPLEARIMAIADVYDALVSRRCYKQPMSFDQAAEIMCDGMGSQFDPSMKDIFIACKDRLEAYYMGHL